MEEWKDKNPSKVPAEDAQNVTRMMGWPKPTIGPDQAEYRVKFFLAWAMRQNSALSHLEDWDLVRSIVRVASRDNFLIFKEITDILINVLKIEVGRPTALKDLSKEKKLESGKLPAIFDGTLDRNAMASALNAVMVKESLSEQKVADRTGFRKNDVNRARNGNATIDKTSEILAALGYPPTVSIPGLE